MYGTLQTDCGYTPKEIRAMTLFDVQRLISHWQQQPPLRVLVSAVAISLGIKLPESQSAKPSYMTEAEARRMIAQTGGRISGVGGA